MCELIQMRNVRIYANIRIHSQFQFAFISMQLLLATTNPAKSRDLKAVFSALEGVKLISLSDFSEVPEVEEIGETFEENATLKAKTYAQHFRMPAVADDGGLEIEALGGAPGVISRRWPGYAADDEELIAYCLQRMADVPEDKRQAQFRTVVAFATPDGEVFSHEAMLPGLIMAKPHPARDPGYPYRSVFYLPDLGKYAVELTDEEQSRLSHRRHALAALLPKIQNHFLQ